MMSDCQSGNNSQLKALQARIDRIDDDLVAHYAGISQIVIGLAANPLTAAAVGPVAAVYNLSGSGQSLLRKLVGLLPGVKTFRNLQKMDAAAYVTGMGENLAAQAGEVAAAMAEQTAANAAQKALAVASLAQAKLQGLVGAALIPFEEEVTRLTGLVNQADAMTSQLLGFMKTLEDIGSCHTRSNIIDPRP